MSPGPRPSLPRPTGLITAALLALSLLPVAAPAAPVSARDWLDRAHQAAGGEAWDAVRSTRARFEVRLPGLDGVATSVTDLTTGRYRDEADFGAFSFASGFDGETAWSRDTSGQVQPQDSQGGREGDASERYRRRLAHFYPERWPAEIEDLGVSEDDGRRFQRIRIIPEGGREFVLWIDHQSHLIDRVVDHDGVAEGTNYLGEYRDFDGRRVPTTTRYSTGEAKFDQHTRLLDFEVNVDFDPARFAMPAPPPPDYRFAGDASETTVPFRLLNNHTYLEVVLDGQGPFTVILDTGGANVITPAVAAQLGLESQGQLEVRGVGEKSQETGLVKIGALTLGEVTLADQVFLVIDFDELSRAEGLVVDGLVGYEVFKRFATRLDYQHSRLTLSDPAGFDYDGPGIPIAFEFDGRTPVVTGAIDGIEGKLTFDTGSRGHVALHAPFVEANGLLERHPEAVEGINGWGVGGPSRSRVLRGSSLRIGEDIVIQRPIMSLSLQERGAMTDRYQIANLGAGILSRFNLVFDYAAQVVYFERHPGSDRQDAYDRAGMWLNWEGAEFEVIGVVAGGPAEQAGLAPGDRVTAVDGTPAAELFLPELRVRWREQAPGTPVRVAYRRDGEAAQTELVLRDLIPGPERLAGGGP